RAGFAPVMLQPVNFEALYVARLQQQAGEAETGGAATAQ
ncbi:protein-export chaperone SecB, partial [Accumulibacter sp.]